MSDGREEVLRSVRKSLNRERPTPQERDSLEARIATPPRHTRPAFEGDLASRVADKLSSRAATVTTVRAMSEVGAAVADFLGRNGIAKNIAVAPALADLAWPQSFEVHSGKARADECVSVTSCFAAVAECGSLVLLSGAESPTTLNFVPENHIVILRAGQIVAHFEDVWLLLRDLPRGMPRAVNVISGPSRTADVEQTIQLGAHGPRRLHVILVARDCLA
jgi:L-lactate dehydrogenase complex protein LldG